MFRYYFIFLICLIVFYGLGSANAADNYKECLADSIDHGNWILEHRRLHNSVRYCIRDAVTEAKSLSEQYSQKIEPMMDEQDDAIKKCKKDGNCEGVPDLDITYTTVFEKNCNSFRVRYHHTCDMNRTLEGFVQKEPISRMRYPQ